MAVCALAHEMSQQRVSGSIVTLICDGGDQYMQSYFDNNWLAARGIDLAQYQVAIGKLFSKDFFDRNQTGV